MKHDELSRERLLERIAKLEAENEALAARCASLETQAAHPASPYEKIILKLINDIKLGMVVIDQSHRVVEVNQRFAEMLGYSVGEMMSLHTWDWEAVSNREDIEKDYADLSKVNFTIETKHRRKDGTLIDVEVSGAGMKIGAGPQDNVVLCFIRDLSLRKRAERLLKESEMKLRAFIENAPDVIFTLSADGACSYISPNCERILGYGPEQLMGGGIFELIEEPFRESYLRDVEAAFAGNPNMVCEYRLKLREYSEWFNVKFSPAASIGGEDIVICSLRNINNGKMNQERLEYLSMHDQLTGIHNRTYFNAVLQGKEGRLEAPVSVIVVDFDELKKVNDGYGHAAGDEVLKACTELIKSVLRKNDIFARVGGDEFTILLPGATEESAELVIKRIYGKIEAFNLLGRLPPISISAGAAVCAEPLDTDEMRLSAPLFYLEEAIKKADERMYSQKREKALARSR